MKKISALLVLLMLVASCSIHQTIPNPAEMLNQEQPGESDHTLDVLFSRYTLLAKEPTPSSWHPNATWEFVLFDTKGDVADHILFRVTDDPATTCLSGNWKKLTVLSERKHTTGNPAYLIEGRNLQILLSSGLCDGYNEINGTLDVAGFAGRNQSSGLLGGTDHGMVLGRAVPHTP